jgi:hypothetical protein
VTETLDLGAVFDRDSVKMPDGTEYQLRNKDEFSIVEDQKLRSLIRQIGEFSESSADSEEDAAKASKMLHDLSTMLVIDAPEDVPDWACVEIFRFWTKRAGAEVPPADPPKPRRRRTTGGSSRNSKRSTAAPRKTGSSKSRRTR